MHVSRITPTWKKMFLHNFDINRMQYSIAKIEEEELKFTSYTRMYVFYCLSLILILFSTVDFFKGFPTVNLVWFLCRFVEGWDYNVRAIFNYAILNQWPYPLLHSDVISLYKNPEPAYYNNGLTFNNNI